MSQSEDETKGFKVTDRRKFTAEGELRSEGEDSGASKPADSPPSPAPEPVSSRASSKEAPTSRPQEASGKAPKAATAEHQQPLTFMDLLSMLATNALVQLGEVPDPASGEKMENVRAAQDMISLLEMLERKTEGNLDKNEEEALEQILYDLRMRFMAKAKIMKL